MEKRYLVRFGEAWIGEARFLNETPDGVGVALYSRWVHVSDINAAYPFGEAEADAVIAGIGGRYGCGGVKVPMVPHTAELNRFKKLYRVE